LLEKVVETKILPSALLWIAGSWAVSRVWLHQNIPLWVLLAFVVILVPASFGVVIAVRMWMTRLRFNVTADPVRSVVCDANWRSQPAIQVQLNVMFANASDYDLLLMYAYIRGATPLMHFEQPVHVEPHSAQQETVLFFCTKPKSFTITETFEATIVFVDASGRRKSQRLRMMGVPAPQSKPQNAATVSSA
jgi:hypothetical protein